MHRNARLRSVPRTIAELLEARACQQGDDVAFRFLDGHGAEQASLTYGQLFHRASDVGSVLQVAGAQPGDRVAITCKAPADFVSAFMGASLCGAIPVPLPAGHRKRGSRVTEAIADCRPAILIGDRAAVSMAGSMPLPHIALDDVPRHTNFRPVRSNPDEPAFLQYTSGTTGRAKGVIVTHSNWLANAAMIREAFGHDSGSCFANWLPLFHDMGLVGTVLQPLFLGSVSVLLPTEAFMQNPSRWLRMISDFGAHTSGAPDTAYRICAQQVRPEMLEGVDLSRWRVAFNGAESVQASTLRSFAATFGKIGFRSQAFVPCYGLAEATLLCAGAATTGPPVQRAFAREALSGRAVEVARTSGVPARALVELGSPVCGISIVRADDGSACPDGHVGEICVIGPNVSGRYWGQALGNGPLQKGFQPASVRTGDLGFLLDGKLFVVGRLKDMFSVAGKNFNFQDIEETARESHSLFRAARGVCLAMDPAELATAFGAAAEGEPVILLQEAHRHASLEELQSAMVALRQALAQQHDIQLTAIAVVRAGSISVTTSGKVQRAETRKRLLSGELGTLAAWTRQDTATTPVEALKELRSGCRNGDVSAMALALARICAYCTGGRIHVGAHPGFAALEMTSLASIRMIDCIRRATGIELPLATMHSKATELQLAQAILDGAAQLGQPLLVPTSPSPNNLLRLDDRQIAIWHRRAEIGDGPYILAFVARYNASVAPRVRSASRTLPRRHSGLATRIICGAGGPAMAPDAAQSPPERDLQCVPTEAHLEAEFAAALQVAFDLELGPLRLVHASVAGGADATLVMVHHMCADFWTLTVLARDLELASRPDASAAGPLVHPLATESNAQRARRDVSYWVRTLEGCRWAKLQTDFAPGTPVRPAIQVPVPVPSAGLMTRAAELGCSPFALLLAGYAVALWASRQRSEDVVILVPVNMRDDSGNSTAGYLVNPLPLRCRIDAGMLFREVVQAIGAGLRCAIDHRSTTLNSLLSRLRELPGAPEHLPLEAAAIHLCSPPGIPQRLAHLALRTGEESVCLGALSISAPAHAAPLEQPLEFVSSQAGADLRAVLRMDRALFSPATAELLASRIAQCLRHLVDDPGAPVGSWSGLGQYEAARIAAWEAPSQHIAAGATIDGLIHRWVRETPDCIATAYRGAQLTYGELWRAASANALNMRQCAGDLRLRRVGVLVRDPQVRVVAGLACLLAGAAFVALNPDAPHAYLSTQVDAASIDLLVVDGGGGTHLFDAPAIAFDPGAGCLMQCTPTDSPDLPVYLVFTSGSTGIPKGIEQSHSAFASFLQWQAAALSIVPGTRVGQVAAPGFDVSCCEIFGALCFGATLCLPDRDTDLAPKNFLDWLDRDHVNCVQTIASFTGEVLRVDARHWPPALQVFANVGEPLSPAQAGEIVRRTGEGFRLVNIYGPSETIAATFHEVQVADLARRRVPVGKPIAGRTVQVLSGEGRVVPAGTVGEIWIVSHDMPAGYACADGGSDGFVTRPDPARGTPGRYRTGDLGCWLSDGVLEVVGRSDNQVKLRGVRIEIGEVESALSNHPQVEQCLVVHSLESGADAALIALVVAPGVAPETLRSSCAATLPPTHIPAEFRLVDTLPRLANGKLDRTRLPRGVQAGSLSIRPTEIRTLNTAEDKVLSIWREYFPTSDLRPESNFFALGGHSIMAMQLLNTLKERLGVQVPVGELLNHPTISALAVRVEERRGDSGP